MIHVAGAAALGRLGLRGPVVARSVRAVPDGVQGIELLHSFDDLFEMSPSEALERIASDLTRLGTDANITYVVPGAGAPGDATVAALDPSVIGGLSTGTPERPGFPSGRFTTVDALELAVAEEQRPFDRGLAAVDPRVPLVVTNWYGSAVIHLAGRRLMRLFDIEHLPEPTEHYELILPPVEALGAVASMSELEHIIARLRRPDGCPWDREQTRESLLPQFEAELVELSEAIERRDPANQAEELGDLLFHVIVQAQVAGEAGDFTFDDVVRSVTGKLVRRHPHVFGDVQVESYDDVLRTWQRVKQEEKSAAAEANAVQIDDERDPNV